MIYKYKEKKFKKLILKVFQQKIEGVTLYDIVVMTGLPTDWVSFTLRKLLNEYPCRLKTNGKGELIYILDCQRKKRRIQDKILTWSRSLLHSKTNKSYAVLSYFLGESQKNHNHLFLEKIILLYIRNNAGCIVVAELIQITGWSIYKAETEIVRLMGYYHGEAEVTEEGVIIYYFEELAQKTEESREIMNSLKIWERPIPEIQVRKKDINPQIKIFAVVFSLISSIYKPIIQWKNKQIRRQNVEIYLLKAIFNHLNCYIFPEKDLKHLIQKVKPQKTYSYSWNQEVSVRIFDYSFILTSTYQREALLQKKALELEASIEVDRYGNLYYHFDRLRKELIIVDREKSKIT